MPFPARVLIIATLAALLACCAPRRSVTVVRSPQGPPMPAELMAPPAGPPPMPHAGHETGATGFLWADLLLDWGADLAHRLAALQGAVRAREAGGNGIENIPLSDGTRKGDE